MRKIFLAVLLLVTYLVTGCTDNQRARTFGGTATETLPAGQKLVNLTWKENSLWVLTRPMQANEQPETYTFRERSSAGLVQGTVIVKEQR